MKRIGQEARSIQEDPSDFFLAQPLETDLFDWHFTILGPDESAFAGGLYHGRIILPNEYPNKPPQFLFCTHNGRFEVGKKICLSISQHHPEEWQAAWGVRAALTAIRSFMMTKADGAIGGIDSSSEQRADLARKSRCFTCSSCGIEHATCPLAATPYTVKLDAEPQSPSLRAAGGGVKPATPSSKPIAPNSPTTSHSPALPPPSTVNQPPSEIPSSSTPAVSSVVAADRAPAVLRDQAPPVVLQAHRTEAAVTPAAQHAPPLTRTASRSSNNRASVDLYVAALSVLSVIIFLAMRRLDVVVDL